MQGGGGCKIRTKVLESKYVISKVLFENRFWDGVGLREFFMWAEALMARKVRESLRFLGLAEPCIPSSLMNFSFKTLLELLSALSRASKLFFRLYRSFFQKLSRTTSGSPLIFRQHRSFFQILSRNSRSSLIFKDSAGASFCAIKSLKTLLSGTPGAFFLLSRKDGW